MTAKPPRRQPCWNRSPPSWRASARCDTARPLTPPGRTRPGAGRPTARRSATDRARGPPSKRGGPRPHCQRFQRDSIFAPALSVRCTRRYLSRTCSIRCASTPSSVAMFAATRGGHRLHRHSALTPAAWFLRFNMSVHQSDGDRQTPNRSFRQCPIFGEWLSSGARCPVCLSQSQLSPWPRMPESHGFQIAPYGTSATVGREAVRPPVSADRLPA